MSVPRQRRFRDLAADIAHYDWPELINVRWRRRNFSLRKDVRTDPEDDTKEQIRMFATVILDGEVKTDKAQIELQYADAAFQGLYTAVNPSFRGFLGSTEKRIVSREGVSESYNPAFGASLALDDPFYGKSFFIDSWECSDRPNGTSLITVSLSAASDWIEKP